MDILVVATLYVLFTAILLIFKSLTIKLSALMGIIVLSVFNFAFGITINKLDYINEICHTEGSVVCLNSTKTYVYADKEFIKPGDWSLTILMLIFIFSLLIVLYGGFK
jgi:hypothetical protein